MKTAPISREQEALEDFIHDRIEKHDVNVLLDYATFVEQELESEPIRNLILGILETPPKQWSFAMAEVATHNRRLSKAMMDIGEHVERQRAAFMEMSAKAILAEAEGAKQ